MNNEKLQLPYSSLTLSSPGLKNRYLDKIFEMKLPVDFFLEESFMALFCNEPRTPTCFCFKCCLSLDATECLIRKKVCIELLQCCSKSLFRFLRHILANGSVGQNSIKRMILFPVRINENNQQSGSWRSPQLPAKTVLIRVRAGVTEYVVTEIYRR